MKQEYFKLISDIDKLSLDCLMITPDKPAKGIVQLVHGMCEYKERYIDFMNYLAELGYICVIHDHRGHGKSVENKQDLGFFYEGGAYGLVEDTHQLTEYVKEELGNKLPYILLGHSMGSMIVRCYAKKYDSDIDKLIVIGSPSKLMGMNLGLFLTKLLGKIKGPKKHSRLLDDLVINNTYGKRFKSEGIYAWVCSDKRVIEAYSNDPYCGYTFTVNGYEQLIKLTKETYSKNGWELNNSSLPIMFVSGAEDPCAISGKDFGKAVHFMKTRGYYNVRAYFISDMRHEVLNEINNKKVYKLISDFIQE